MIIVRFKLEFDLNIYLKDQDPIMAEIDNDTKIELNIQSGKKCEGILYFKEYIDPPNINLIEIKNKGKLIVEKYFMINELLIDILIGDINFPDDPEVLEKIITENVVYSSAVSAKIRYEITTAINKTSNLRIIIDDREGRVSDYRKLMENTAVKTFNNLKSLSKVRNNESSILQRSIDWNHRANGTDDVNEKFIYRWITFDILTGVLVKMKPTINLIPEFVHKYFVKAAKIVNQKYKDLGLYNELIKRNFASFGSRRSGRLGGRSQKLNYEIIRRRPSNKRIIQLALECIYEYRNEIIHMGHTEDMLTKQVDQYLSEIISIAILAILKV